MKEILCSFLVRTLQYLKKNLDFFCPWKHEKLPSKVAHNQPQFFFSVRTWLPKRTYPNGPQTEIPYHQKPFNAELGIWTGLTHNRQVGRYRIVTNNTIVIINVSPKGNSLQLQSINSLKIIGCVSKRFGYLYLSTHPHTRSYIDKQFPNIPWQPDDWKFRSRDGFPISITYYGNTGCGVFKRGIQN